MANVIYLPNLWFENELRGEGSRPPAHLQDRIDDLAPSMSLLSLSAGPRDDSAQPSVTCLVRRIPDDKPELLRHVQFVTLDQADTFNDGSSQLIPWGWSQTAHRVAARLGVSVGSPPDADSVLAVNSRRFQAQFDLMADVEGGEPFSSVCENIPQVVESLHRFADCLQHGWVIKADYSASGRDRLLGRRPLLTDSDKAWLQRIFAQPQLVVVEPWVDRLAERGLQFTVGDTNQGRRNSPQIVSDGVTELLNTKSGQYLGSIIPPSDFSDAFWQPAVESGIRIATDAARRGYRGPLGIDCMAYRGRDGTPVLRTVHDINGRCTMGRLALSCRQLAAPHEWLAWLCLSQAKFLLLQKSVSKSRGAGVRLIRTSPQAVGGRPVGAITVAAIAQNRRDLLSLLQSD